MAKYYNMRFGRAMKQFLTIVLLSFSTMGITQAGGPWPQPKGKGYFKLYQWWIVFDEHFTDSGGLDPNVTTGIFNTSVYAEYGLTNRLTGVLHAPLFSRNYMNNLISVTTGETLVKGEALNAMGDIDIGLKYGLTKAGSRFPVSLMVMIGLPTGTIGGGSLGNLQTGDGEFNQMLQLDVGKGFSLGEKVVAYTSAYGGFNHRTKGFSEEFRYGIEFGVGLMQQKLWLISRLNGIESLKNGLTAADADIESVSIFANNTEFTSFGLEANYYFKKRWGVSVGAAGAFRGEIIAAAPTYNVGVFFDLSR